MAISWPKKEDVGKQIRIRKVVEIEDGGSGDLLSYLLSDKPLPKHWTVRQKAIWMDIASYGECEPDIIENTPKEDVQEVLDYLGVKEDTGDDKERRP